MLKILALLALLLAPEAAQAQQRQDQCSTLTNSSAVVNISSATTTSIVALVTGKRITVCGFAISNPPSGTSASTFVFEYGTGAACSTPTALTGAFGAGFTTAGAPIFYSYGDGTSTIFSTAISNGLCLLTAGTTVNIQGVVTYVQQ